MVKMLMYLILIITELVCWELWMLTFGVGNVQELVTLALKLLNPSTEDSCVSDIKALFGQTNTVWAGN